MTSPDTGKDKKKSLWLRMKRGSHSLVGLTTLIVLILVVSISHQGASSDGNQDITTLSVDSFKIPECDASPWKPQEDLLGTCPGIRTPENAKDISNAADCAKLCCADNDCVTWQYRRDKGCLMGGDVRIGMEKDGPTAYCSDHPPYRWQGQFVRDRHRVKDEAACSTATWNPQQHEGQCFGLGDVRKGLWSAQDCMTACCGDEICGAWQFQPDLGCFYSNTMFSCQKSDDPVVFEPFVGRRKFRKERTYTGPKRATKKL